MKAAILLLALACVAHALPVQPDVESSVHDVHGVQPAHPRVEEWDVETHEDAAASEQLVRERRSPRGWQPRHFSHSWQPRQSPRGWQSGGGGGFPHPQPQPQQPRGSVSGSVHREKGVGTVVQAHGQGNVWTSKDGRSRVDAQGQWSKVVSGPGRGKPNYNVGATFEHKF